jgi:DNA-directed RNA polymerase specialized sigma24 family protein
VRQADTRADIYERHRRELVNYATRLVVRESVAEELAQEAALRLLQDQRLPATRSDQAWLFRVVSNLMIDHCVDMVLEGTGARRRARAPSPIEFVAEPSNSWFHELAAIARSTWPYVCLHAA